MATCRKSLCHGRDRIIREDRRFALDDTGNTTRAELAGLRRKLGLPPAEWIRKGEAEFKEARLDANSPEDKLLDAMAKHPILIERPIVVRGDRAVVGRPPERVLELLGK